MTPRLAARIAFAFALALVVIGVGAIREARIAARALDRADDAWAHGDPARAIGAARDAARAYVPWTDAAAGGRSRLLAIAEESEARGDAKSAVTAWRALRDASLATRAIGHDPRDLVARADDAVARIAARARLADDPTHAASNEPAPRPDPIDAPPPLTFMFLAIGAFAFFGGAASLLTAFGKRIPGAPMTRHEESAAIALALGLVVYAFTYVRG